MFVIAGVTGNTGGVVAKTLLDEGQKVRVIVRSADKAAAYKARGAEVFVGVGEGGGSARGIDDELVGEFGSPLREELLGRGERASAEVRVRAGGSRARGR